MFRRRKTACAPAVVSCCPTRTFAISAHGARWAGGDSNYLRIRYSGSKSVMTIVRFAFTRCMRVRLHRSDLSPGDIMPSLRSSALAAIGFIVALALSSTLSPAQTPAWPQRIVKFVIPPGPGSGVDITARVFADKLSQKWRQTVVVENPPGGDAFVA